MSTTRKKKSAAPNPLLCDDIAKEVAEYEKIWAEECAMWAAFGSERYFTQEQLDRVDVIQRRRAQIEGSLTWFVIHKVRDAQGRSDV